MLDNHNKQQVNLKINSKNFQDRLQECNTVDSPKNNLEKNAQELKIEENGYKINKIENSKTIQIKNPFRENDYWCDSISESDCEVLNAINMKKMNIMNCYLRFMRLAHIGNGLEIYWRKVLDIDIDVSYNQYYEMIEYKTSEILVFMIDCLCILHDVRIMIFLII